MGIAAFEPCRAIIFSLHDFILGGEAARHYTGIGDVSTRFVGSLLKGSGGRKSASTFIEIDFLVVETSSQILFHVIDILDLLSVWLAFPRQGLAKAISGLYRKFEPAHAGCCK